MQTQMVHGEAHPAQWWAEFLEHGDRFDAAYALEEFADLVTRHIAAPLLRREAETAIDVIVRSLSRPGNEELATRARAAAARLDETLRRIDERSGGLTSTAEAAALLQAVNGHFDVAAAQAEPFVGTAPLRRLLLTALRIERMDIGLAVRMLDAGQQPRDAVRSATLLAKYAWWPDWLLRIVTERAMAGTLDEDTIAALDKCAYASLSPAQARLARRLLAGEAALITTAAERLETVGQQHAAEGLRRGDLAAVAVAARLIPI